MKVCAWLEQFVVLICHNYFFFSLAVLCSYLEHFLLPVALLLLAAW